MPLANGGNSNNLNPIFTHFGSLVPLGKNSKILHDYQPEQAINSSALLHII